MRLSRRQLAAGALLVAVLTGEVAGRWLAANLPLVGHVPRRVHDGLDAWPALVVLAKVGIALLVARLAWRLVRALRVAVAGERMLVRSAGTGRPAPTVGLSPRAWLVSFVAMCLLYLVPTSSAEVTAGCWPLVAPWMHTQALPVFAVLAVVIAVLWRTVSRWLAALEDYGERLHDLIRSTGRLPDIGAGRRTGTGRFTPRSLFGVSFESRPPPVPA